MSDQQARERAEADVIRTFVEVKSSASPYGQEQKQEVLDALAALLAENEKLKRLYENRTLEYEKLRLYQGDEFVALVNTNTALLTENKRLKDCVGLLPPRWANHFWHLYRTHPALARDAADTEETT